MKKNLSTESHGVTFLMQAFSMVFHSPLWAAILAPLGGFFILRDRVPNLFTRRRVMVLSCVAGIATIGVASWELRRPSVTPVSNELDATQPVSSNAEPAPGILVSGNIDSIFSGVQVHDNVGTGAVVHMEKGAKLYVTDSGAARNRRGGFKIDGQGKLELHNVTADHNGVTATEKK
jgi:hypothetical protein